nr:hypothetical protein [Tanacetum cinerariifolium]
MDPNSIHGKICLGNDVIKISSDKVKGSRDWNPSKYQDIAGSKGKKVTKALSFYNMETDEVRVITVYLKPDPFEEDSKKEEKTGGYLTQEEVEKEALAIRISQKFALLEEKDKVELDGKIVKEEEAVKRIKGEALKEKYDLGAFIFSIRLVGKVNKNALADIRSDINTMPYRIYETLGREEMKKVDRGIIMINHTQTEAMGILFNVLCQVGVTTIIANFIILDIPIDRDAQIVVGRGFLDSDDEEEYQINMNKFGSTIYGLKPAPYLNCNDPADRSLALQAVTNPFRKISVWKKEEAIGQWRTEIRLTGPYGNIYIQGFTTKKTDQKLSKLWEHTMMKPDNQDPNALDNVKSWKKYCFNKFTMNFCYGKIRAFNINEPIYMELCHEFYLTYEFDEVNADDELQTKKIIKFRLGGRAHSLTLLEFSHRLGLYQAAELDKEGFNVYFEGVLRVIHKMITYGLCQRTTEYDKIQKNNLWLLSMFHARHQNWYANVAWLIARLIPEDPQPGVPRVGIPRPPREFMQDLYVRMGRMEIHQEEIERIKYRQSYHWDRYQEVFEHMAGVYSVPL